MKKLYILLFLTSYSASSQLSWGGNMYSLESSLFVSSDSTLPFWMRSQTYGEVPVESQFLQLKASIHHEYDSTYNLEKKLQRFGFGHGATLVSNMGKVNQFIASEAFVKVRYGVFEAWAGRRKEIIGLVDSTLSSGSLIWGGNSVPIPKVQFGLPNYTPVLGKGLLSIKGSYAHGWFGSTDSVKKYFLHQKSLYARIGKPYWKFKFYAGFNHQVQWGGAPTVPFYDRVTDQYITSFQNDLSTYIQVVSGVSLNKKGDQVNGTNGVAYNEAFNRAGNHLGTLDVAFEYSMSNLKFYVYRQSIYEDGSLFYLSNIEDGLFGFSISPVTDSKSDIKFNKFNVEILNSKNQGGPGGSRNVIPELRGQDNYFNNAIYEDGWTYKERSLANAFFMPSKEYMNLFDNIDNIYSSKIVNSRLSALIASCSFSYKQSNLTAKLSRSGNLGNYAIDLGELVQYSAFLSFSTKVKKLRYKLSIGGDWGDFVGNRVAFNAGLVRNLYQ